MYISVLNRSFSITVPVYNKNCLNLVTFHLSISLSALVLHANSMGTFFWAPTNLSVSTVTWDHEMPANESTQPKPQVEKPPHAAKVHKVHVINGESRDHVQGGFFQM